MTRERRRRSGSGRRTANLVPQLPWRSVENGFRPLEILDPEQIERIHDCSLRILEELGVELMNAESRDLFEQAGATVDHETGVVRVDRGLLESLLATAPSSVTLTPRNPEHAITLGGRHLNFTLVAGPPNVHDCVNGRRAGNYRDYCDLVRLAQSLNIIHLIGNQPTAPQELPASTRHLDTYLANLTLTDRTFHCTAIGAQRARDGIEMSAIARGISMQEIVQSPSVLTVINVNSPRRLDDELANGLIEMARCGQACVITPFTLMGAMTPVTLPAALAQQNAEALFGIALTQLVRPGAPAVYGAFTSNVDMRTGAPAFGTPENTKANIAAGQLARRYGLPYRTSDANASNVVDAQAAYETEMSLWGAVLGGANIVYHAAGWLEGGLTASFEKVILDAELLQSIVEVMKPIEVDDDSLALDAMRAVEPGGHFFGADHTMSRYETAFYRPLLSDWQNHANWEAAGSKTATERATEIWQRLLAEYTEPAMDPAVREQLEDYVARRREEIGREGLDCE
ncbi:MAG: trimethylamine methyltransferase family protein [Halofilum sp. (in: g-proteobacteria)]|nr:trimethylamine methyltransferase family protein [Halofilum sp. (in: g-proteobacteria)]